MYIKTTHYLLRNVTWCTIQNNGRPTNDASLAITNMAAANGRSSQCGFYVYVCPDM